MREIKYFPDKKIVNIPPGFAAEWTRLTTKIRDLYGEEQLKKIRLVPHKDKKGVPAPNGTGGESMKNKSM